MRKRAAKSSSATKHSDKRSADEIAESKARLARAEHRRKTWRGGVRRPVKTHREIRYTRVDWINKTVEILVNAGHAFHMARLEAAHGRPGVAAQWMIECRLILSFGNVRLLSDVKRRFDRKEACKHTIRELDGWSKTGRVAAEQLFYRAYGDLQHQLVDGEQRISLYSQFSSSTSR